jgi:hypothetical protein
MRRLLLWVLALVIAAAPAVADVCRLDCARERQPACPQHQTAPHRCSHDHAIAAADLTRASADAQRPIVAGIVVALPDFRRSHDSIVLVPVEPHQTPPLQASRTDVLRI